MCRSVLILDVLFELVSLRIICACWFCFLLMGFVLVFEFVVGDFLALGSDCGGFGCFWVLALGFVLSLLISCVFRIMWCGFR